MPGAWPASCSMRAMISFPDPVGPVISVVLRARANVATRANVDCITGESATNVVAINRVLLYSRGSSITVSGGRPQKQECDRADPFTKDGQIAMYVIDPTCDRCC